MKRMTVHDVAEQAGVSLATVDRVLNGRPGVSRALTARVRQTIEQIGFQRDHYAASLATSRRHRFVFVLPRLPTNSFICALHDEVQRQGRQLAARRTQLATVEYTAFDAQALAEALTTLAKGATNGGTHAGSGQGIDGVALVAVDAPVVRAAIETLHEAGTAVVTLVSDVTPSRRLHCIGIDNLAAGRLAATLIGRFNARREGRIAMIAGSLLLRDHSERILGFSQVLRRDFPQLTVLPAREGRDAGRVTGPITDTLLAEHADLIGIYSIGGGNRGIIAALEQSGRARDIVVIAHELTPHTRRALLSGTIDAVLHQPIADEITIAVEALRAACDRSAGHAPPPIRIDIFLRDNLT